MRPSELSEEQWSNLLEGLVLAEYSLVLGAGASMGSRNRTGSELPSGAGLRDRLVDHYRIPGGADRNLRQIYDVASNQARAEGSTPPSQVIKPWFTGCTVADWYKDLVTVPWRVIWNLNIDDVLTNAYRKTFYSRARQDLQVATWDEPWTLPRNVTDRVRMVHLHGSASGEDLVFGTLEYLALASRKGAAHAIFSDEWAAGLPTIVLGASLEDELDLANSLLGEVATDTNRPSLIVKPSFSEFELYRLRQGGLTPVQMTAEQFFTAVSDDWEATLSSIEDRQMLGATGINPSAVSFLQTFHKPTDTSDRWHDFFAGDEPTWGDLRNDLDSPRLLEDPPQPEELSPENGLRIYAFHGELSGTTTAEMRFLEDARRAGFRLLEYVGEGKFDAKAIHWMAKQGRRDVLRIPRLDDYPDAASELESMCSESGVPVVLVTSIRSSRLANLRAQLGSSLRAIRVRNNLTDPEVRALLDKLDKENRLNRITSFGRNERLKFIKETHGSSLIDSLADISRGRSFSARYVEAYREVTNPVGQRILDTLLVASEARVNLSIGILTRAIGIASSDLLAELGVDPLPRLIHSPTRGSVAARHTGLAARASKEVLSVDRRYSATIELASAAAPYVHPTSISQRTKEVLLVAKLMDAQRVVNSLGRERAAEFFEELEPVFAWNSRFWEQRALAELESSKPRWERAESWAREAVKRHSDALSLNTLATILLRRAVAGDRLDETTYFEGLETVDQARQASVDRITEHPYVTALVYLLRGRRLAKDASTKQRIDTVFNFWRLDVERSRTWEDAKKRNELESHIAKYLNELD